MIWVSNAYKTQLPADFYMDMMTPEGVKSGHQVKRDNDAFVARFQTGEPRVLDTLSASTKAYIRENMIGLYREE